ncbi:MAG: lytic murein transglycosylase [Desulfatibacillum sp.]|nr:lytic murein transglycosylase [Desulfatibacillum sp.]
MLVRLTGMLIALVIAAFLGTAVGAEQPPPPSFENLQNRLIKDGFDKQQLEKIYNHKDVELDLSVATVYFRHRESKSNYDQFLEDKTIANARAYLAEHKTDLEATEKAYGVDKEVITAILLVETRLGGYVGVKPVINTLSTLASLSEESKRSLLFNQVSKNGKQSREQVDAWAEKKAAWAYEELKAFLSHTDSSETDPVGIKGSFAGAMGYAQFMPSNILVYGADGSGDGKVDLFVHSDAIASIGLYLKGHGWKPGLDAEKMGKVLLRYNNSTYYANTLLRIRAVLRGSS